MQGVVLQGIFVPGPGQELATRSSARVDVAQAHKVRTLEPRAQTHTLSLIAAAFVGVWSECFCGLFAGGRA